MLTKLGTYQRIGLAIVIVGGVIWGLLTQTNLLQKEEVPVVAATPISVEKTTEVAVVEPQADPAASPETETAASPEETAPVEAEEVAMASVEAEEAPVDTAPAAEAILPLPSFDVVRVESDGTAIVAGSAPAGWTVSILLDGVEVTSVVADASGQFAGFADFGHSDFARVVTLSATDGTRVLMSDAQVIIAPVLTMVAEAEPEEASADPITAAEGTVTEIADAAAEQVETMVATVAEAAEEAVTSAAEAVESAMGAEEVTEETAQVEAAQEGEASVEAAASVEEEADAVEAEVAAVDTGETAPVSEEAANEVSASEEATTSSAEQTTAANTAKSPAVLLVGKDGVEVLQPAKSGPEAMVELAIDAISYTENGDVQLSGRSASGFLRVYLDNQPMTTLEVPEPGSWQANLVDVAPGVYTLRVDRLDQNGQVLGRVETPFKREEPAKVQEIAQKMASGTRPAVSVVQPGSTLWAISRQTYGAGVLYVSIFEANRDQIRDPNLIYPGQIFELPAPPGAKKKKGSTGQ